MAVCLSLWSASWVAVENPILVLYHQLKHVLCTEFHPRAALSAIWTGARGRVATAMSRTASFAAFKVLCEPPPIPALPGAWKPPCFTVCLMSPFPEHPIIGIVQEVAFPNCLLPLSDVHLRPLCVFWGTDGLFLFILK